MTQFFEFPISNLTTISFFILLPSGFWTHGNHQWPPPNQIQWHCWVPTFSITCYILFWLHRFRNSLSCLGLTASFPHLSAPSFFLCRWVQSPVTTGTREAQKWWRQARDELELRVYSTEGVAITQLWPMAALRERRPSAVEGCSNFSGNLGIWIFMGSLHLFKCEKWIQKIFLQICVNQTRHIGRAGSSLQAVCLPPLPHAICSPHRVRGLLWPTRSCVKLGVNQDHG